MHVLDELKRTSDERFLAMYETLAQQGFGPLDGEVAKLLKFRPQAIRKLPMAQRAKRAKALMLARNNVELCYELFGSWLLKERKGLVTGFLNATGVEHKDGLIEDLEKHLPQEKKLAAAVAELDSKFEPSDVTLYLALCAQQWPSVEGLGELYRARS